MEIITPEESKAELSKEIDEKVRKVFNYAIELFGGQKLHIVLFLKMR